MRKLTVLLLLALPSYAAIASGTHWDVRTTGSDANGGGFNVSATGTDRSQQDAAFIAFTDLVIGATTTQATSAAHPFDSTSPGNIVNVISGAGCTVQRAQVVSVSGATATFDKSLGTAASTCTGNLGGALLTHATVFSLTVSGNTVWTKAGTYTITAFFSNGSSVNWIGYNATHGDIHGANLARPLITSATSALDNLYNPTGPLELIQNLSFSTTASPTPVGSGIANTGSNVITIINCLFDGFVHAICAQGGVCGSSPSVINVIDSEIKNGTANAINWGNELNIKHSYIHNNGTGSTCAGQIVSSTSSSTLNMENSILSAGANCGILFAGASGGFVAVSKSDVANNGAEGIRLSNAAGAGPLLYLEGNIIYGNATYGVSLNTAPQLGQVYINDNGFGANGTANYLNTSGLGDVAFSVSPFTSSTNFALNSTVGGGAAAKGAGFPGAFPGGTTTGGADLGPVQSSAGPTASQFACGFSSLRVPELSR